MLFCQYMYKNGELSSVLDGKSKSGSRLADSNELVPQLRVAFIQEVQSYSQDNEGDSGSQRRASGRRHALAIATGAGIKLNGNHRGKPPGHCSAFGHSLVDPNLHLPSSLLTPSAHSGD